MKENIACIDPTKKASPSVPQAPEFMKVSKTSETEPLGAIRMSGMRIPKKPITWIMSTIASICGSKRARYVLTSSDRAMICDV